jgi:hypothetical protein
MTDSDGMPIPLLPPPLMLDAFPAPVRQRAHVLPTKLQPLSVAFGIPPTVSDGPGRLRMSQSDIPLPFAKKPRLEDAEPETNNDGALFKAPSCMADLENLIPPASAVVTTNFQAQLETLDRADRLKLMDLLTNTHSKFITHNRRDWFASGFTVGIMMIDVQTEIEITTPLSEINWQYALSPSRLKGIPYIITKVLLSKGYNVHTVFRAEEGAVELVATIRDPDIDKCGLALGNAPTGYEQNPL